MDHIETKPDAQEVADDSAAPPDESNAISYDANSENSELCWKCRALLNSSFPAGIGCSQTTPVLGENPERTLETTNSLEETAHGGCSLCRRLMDAIEPRMQKILRNLAGQELRYSYILYTEDDNNLNLFLWIRRPFDGQNLEGVHYWIASKLKFYEEIELGGTMTQSLVEDHTDSRPTQLLVCRWVAECNTSHQQCIATRKKTNFLPSRLINITPDQPLHLVVTRNLTSATLYTTLSHCWGTNELLQLSSSNLAKFQREIPFSQLSKTFQDAVHTSRLLGVHHIWIDSLCIIQDSKQDWEEESAAMAGVYSNSYCNISASHATDGRFGCFTTRDPASVTPLKVNLGWGHTSGAKYTLNLDFWEQNVQQSALDNRAWVFQEATLAPRNLIFGGTEVLFECNQVRASESFPSQLPKQMKETTIRKIQPSVAGQRLRHKMGLEPDSTLNAITAWGDIVERYSHLELSVLTDKLVALSAIASEMQPSMNSEYLAGMWSEHLPCQLLWNTERFPHTVDNAYPNPRRSKEYVAPSWSWASVHGRVLPGPIKRSSEDWEILIKMVDTHVEPQNILHPYGQVKSGCLSIMGSLAECVLSGSIQYDRWSAATVNPKTVLGVTLDHDENLQTFESQVFYLLPVLRWFGISRDQFCVPRKRVSGLVLRPTGFQRHEYCRVAFFEDLFEEKFQEVCRAFAAESEGNTLEKDGWGPRHLITII